jgi:hypothetical protein
MARWPTAKHFTSWLCLLRIAAVNVGRTQTALGAFYRRLAARIDKPKS